MPTVSPRLDDRFWSGTARAGLPIAIWGAHFFISYWAGQFACQIGLQRYTVAGVSSITVALWLLTAAAIVVLIVMIVLQGRRIRTNAEHKGVQGAVQMGVAIFALIGVVWSTVPVLVAAPCANPYELNRSVRNAPQAGAGRTAAIALFIAAARRFEICVVR